MTTTKSNKNLKQITFINDFQINEMKDKGNKTNLLSANI